MKNVTKRRLEAIEAKLASWPETRGDTLDLTLLSDGELDLLIAWQELGRPEEWVETVEAILDEAIERGEHFGPTSRGACRQDDWLGRSCAIVEPRLCRPASCTLYYKCPATEQ